MPNPLIQSAAYRTSRPAPDRFVPANEEHVEDQKNIPYRGNVDHGGPDVDEIEYNSDLTGDVWEETREPATFDPSERPVEPLPVKIVRDGTKGRQRSVMRTRTDVLPNGGVANTTGEVVRIAGLNDQRTKLTLKCVAPAGATVYIGHDMTVANAMHGFPLVNGETLALNVSSAVYACAFTVDPVGALVTLRIVEELVQPL